MAADAGGRRGGRRPRGKLLNGSAREERPSVRAYLLLGTGMAVFGSGTPVSKVVTDAFPVFLASGLRMALAAAVLVPLLAWSLRGEVSVGALVTSLDRADWARVGAIALAGMFGFSLFMLYGMKEVSGAIGGIVMATTPAVTATGSVIFLRSHLDRWTSLAIGLSVAGLVAVNVGGGRGEGSGGDVLLGTLLVFGAVCGEAAYTLLGKRLGADLTPVAIAAIAAVLAGALFAPFAAADATGFDASAPGATDWLALAWWGLGTMSLGSVLWYRGVQRVAGTTASAFMGVMPVSALLLSYLLLGEAFAPVHAIGMAAVLVAIAAVTLSHGRSG